MQLYAVSDLSHLLQLKLTYSSAQTLLNTLHNDEL